MGKRTVPLRHRKNVWIWVPPISILILVVYQLGLVELAGEGMLVAAMSGLLGTVFFLHRSHSEDARFMKELFEHFNARYDQLNGSLQAILDAPEEPFDDELKATIRDYFNLCAEEWVFRSAGYVYDPVWESWENGMRQYSSNLTFRRMWRTEQKSGSYYGFEFPEAQIATKPEGSILPGTASDQVLGDMAA